MLSLLVLLALFGGCWRIARIASRVLAGVPRSNADVGFFVG